MDLFSPSLNETDYYYNDPVEACTELLAFRNQSVAFAESATAGILTSTFAAADHSSVLKGGIICYDAIVKTQLLRVDPQLIEQYTAESAIVTRAITAGLRRLIPADYYIGITGLIKPGGSETPEKPVGTVFACIMQGDLTRESRVVFHGNKEDILHGALEHTCQQLIETIMTNTSK